MNTEGRVKGARATFVTIVIGICAVLLLTALPSLVQPAMADLPPRPPTPTSTPAPVKAVSGAEIELWAAFDPAWPWATVPWQDLRTVVEWQSSSGNWYRVEGWQGGFDDVELGDGGRITGMKNWWVGRSELAKGPFRWLVLRGEYGAVVVVSDPFHLPSGEGETVKVQVSLAP